MTSFVSVATGAARYQDISMNPQKLAGQCAKLKCCINYEVDSYVEAQKRLPSREVILETKDSNYYHFKTDIFKREITYSTDRSFAANLVTISADRAFDIIGMNKRGNKPVNLEGETKPEAPKRDAQDILGQESLTRFDNTVKKKKKKRPNEGGDREQGPVKASAEGDSLVKKVTPVTDNQSPVKKAGNPNEGNRPESNKSEGNQPKGNKPDREQTRDRDNRNPRDNRERPNRPNRENGNRDANPRDNVQREARESNQPEGKDNKENPVRDNAKPRENNASPRDNNEPREGGNPRNKLKNRQRNKGDKSRNNDNAQSGNNPGPTPEA